MEVAAWFVLWGLAPVLVSSFSFGGKQKKSKQSLESTTTTTCPKRTVFGVERSLDLPHESFPLFPSDKEMELSERHLLPGCQHGWFESCYQGAQLHYRNWMPPSKNPKAIVIFMHGISTHSGKAFILPNGRKLNAALQAEMFLDNNIAMYAFDLYGHGFSEGVRWWIPDTWETNVQDYIAFCQLVAATNDKNVPVFLMGESYGCTLTLEVAKHFQEHPDPKFNLNSLILTAPAIIGDVPPFPVLQLLMFLAKRYPTWRPFFMPNPISPQRIWRDPQVLDIRTNPRYVQTGIDGSGLPFRLGTGSNLVRALEHVRTQTIPKLKLPFLIIHGTDDFGVPIEGSNFLWENAATPEQDRSFCKKPGAYHDLLADYVAEECMQETLDWIDRRLAASQ